MRPQTIWITKIVLRFAFVIILEYTYRQGKGMYEGESNVGEIGPVTWTKCLILSKQ